MSRTRFLLLASACLAPMLATPAILAQAQGTGPEPQPPVRRAPLTRTAPTGLTPLTRLPPPARSTPARATPARSAPTRAAAARANPVRTSGEAIADIRVVGNERIEAGTVRSYMLVQPGDRFEADRIDRSLKALYATGLFHDVSLTQQGATLVVKVVENPIVNAISFEGDHKLTDDNLRPLLDLRPRAVFTPELAQADRQKILNAYAKRGRFGATVEPKIIRLEQNRVNVVFEITEGSSTLISRIAFVGNHAFSESRLREIINTREEAFYRFLSTSDSYDPERVNFDRELLRRFYLKNGYADFSVRDATAELAPDRSAFFLTFTLNEGERYTVGSVNVESKLRNVTGASLAPLVQQAVGDTYDGDAVERSTTAIEDAVQNRGYAFVQVRPRIARNKEKHTVDLVFDVSEGPRVYVERIDIQGNTRTKDKVVRREMQLAEGDAFNAAAIRRSRLRLQDLGYFNTVTVTPSPGSTSDKAVVTATVDEKATGELTFGGGFSTDAGALVNLGLHEKNLIGTGVDARLSGVLAQRRDQINFSLTDPYFLDRNLVGGIDLFRVANNNQYISNYSETRTGGALRLGYEFNEHLRQAVSYSLVERSVTDVSPTASLFIQDEAGTSLLSQVGQTLTLDYRDSRTDPHSGFVVNYGLDVAGLGGTAHYVRNKVDGTYFYPLEWLTGDSDWGVAISGGAGYLLNTGDRSERIIDRFFLGGDNLRGFQSGGAGPHSIPIQQGGITFGSDSIGGRFIYTQSTELRFPLPISADLGLSGRAFVDVGGLTGAGSLRSLQTIDVYNNPQTVQQLKYDAGGPRMGTGVGVSWRTPFGLINIDLAQAVIKKKYDQTQFFRFGFGTRF